jgi:N-acetylmuramoyl-L-alanine amidase
MGLTKDIRNVIAFFTILAISLFGFQTKTVLAEQLPIMIQLDTVVEGKILSGTIPLVGWSLGTSGIQKLELSVDGGAKEQMIYGQGRPDVAAVFPSYPQGAASGFSYSFNSRKYSNGYHILSITATGNDGKTLVRQWAISIYNQQTSINGQTIISKEQMIKYFLDYGKNSSKDNKYISDFVDITLEEAIIEGIRPDVAFAQMMKETGFLKFGGDVKEEQNNFAGIGATGNGVPGESFKDIRTGIRAVIQHLKAYASKEPLKQAVVDPRYKLVTKGCAPYVEWLGINANPYGAGWAPSETYGYDIVNMINKMKAIVTEQAAASVKSFNIGSDFLVGKSYTIAGEGTSTNKVLYQFWVKDNSKGTLELVQDYSMNGTFAWTPAKAGNYRIEMRVKDQYSNKEFDNIAFKDVTVKDVAVKPPAIAQVTGFNIGSDFQIAKSHTITGTGTSANNVLYQFWVKDYSKGTWALIQDYSTNGTFVWTPAKTGDYRVEMHVKDQNSSKEFDNIVFKDVTVRDAATKPPAIAQVTGFSIGSDFQLGKAHTIIGTGTSANNVLYQFWVKDHSKGTWALTQDYSANGTFVWTPAKIGDYRVEMHVKDQYSSKEFDNIAFKDVTVRDAAAKPPEIAKVTGFNIGSDFQIGKSHTITGTGTSTNKVLYQFWVKDYSKGTWALIQDYSENENLIWTPAKTGDYRVEMHIKDQYSINEFDNIVFKDVTVKDIVTQPIAVAKVTDFITGLNFQIGKSYIITGRATSTNKVLYQFWIKDNSKGMWSLAQDYSEKSSFTWTPAKIGNYTLRMHVKDQYSKNGFDDVILSDVIVKSEQAAVITIMIDAGHGGTDPGAIASSNGATYEEARLNLQVALKLQAELKKFGYNIILTRYEDNKTLELKDRTTLANNANVDLFISLHHNAAVSTASGIETHYSSYKPGIDMDGVIVGSDPRGYYNGVNIDTTPSNAALVSRDLAKKLTDGLSTTLGYINRYERDHNLYVTQNTNMASILIELGFITNPDEAKRCADNNDQMLKAQKIAQIINDYYKNK